MVDQRLFVGQLGTLFSGRVQRVITMYGGAAATQPHPVQIQQILNVVPTAKDLVCSFVVVMVLVVHLALLVVFRLMIMLFVITPVLVLVLGVGIWHSVQIA